MSIVLSCLLILSSVCNLLYASCRIIGLRGDGTIHWRNTSNDTLEKYFERYIGEILRTIHWRNTSNDTLEKYFERYIGEIL